MPMRSMVDDNPLITVQKAKATIIDATGVSLSQQTIRVVVETLGYSPKKRPNSGTAIFHRNGN
jgi:transposase